MNICKSLLSRALAAGSQRVPRYFFAKTAAASSPVQAQANEPAGAFDPLAKLKENLENFNASRLETLFKNYSFDENIEPSLNFLKAMKLSKAEITNIFKLNPECFITAPGDKGRNNLYRQFDYLQTELKFDLKRYRDTLLKDPKLASLSVQDLKSRMAFLAKAFKLEQSSVSSLLETYPTLFLIDNFEYVLAETARYLQNYTHVQPERIGKILQRHPFLFNIPPDHLKGNVKQLLYRRFQPQQIAAMIELHPQFLTMKPGHFERCFDVAKKFGLSQEEVPKIFSENSRLFLVCPNSVMPYKIKLLERFNVDVERQSKLFRQHPRLYVKSLGSLELKLKYLTQRHKMNLLEEETFPAILHYNYNETIRPRGELLLKHNINIPWKTFLNKSDKEFCDMIGAPLEQLEKLKAERSFNNELDEKAYFFSQQVKLDYSKEEY